MKDIKKIAVLRANALGDFIVTLPALNAIRNTYPTAEIVLLGRPWHRDYLIAGRSPIDRVIVVPVKKGIRTEVNEIEDIQQVTDFFEAMQQENFDIAIHFQGNGISANPFITRLNARLTAGLTTGNAAPLDRSINFYYYQSEVLRYLEVAALIDARPTDIEPRISVLKQDKEEIKGLLHFLHNKHYVVLHPFATDKRRAWPIENYLSLANRLKQKNVEVVFTGSKKDKDTVEDIIAVMENKAINTCGTVSLGGLTALLAGANLVIAPDTGPLHVARAVKTPTVGIYWAPNFINWGPLSRSIHHPLLSWNMTCPYCGIIPNTPFPFEPQSSCTHEVSFVRNITVEAVMEAAENLLSLRKIQKKQDDCANKSITVS